MTQSKDSKLKTGIVIFTNVVLTGVVFDDDITLREVLEVRGSAKVADTRFVSPAAGNTGPDR